MFLIDRGKVKNWLSTGYVSVTLHANCSFGQRQLLLGNSGSGRTSFLSNIGLNSTLNSYYFYLFSSFNFYIYNFIGSSRKEYVYLKFLHNSLNKKFNFFVDSTISLDLYNQLMIPYNVVSDCLILAINGVSSIHFLDSLTNHAKLYRSFMLILKRSPGREAFPGDVFYLHSRLLENYGQFNKFFNYCSITALPVVTLHNEDVTDYITTNLISITDGQWFFSKSLNVLNLFPSFDVNLSVSRLGSITQDSLLRLLSTKFKSFVFSYLLLEEQGFSSSLSKSTRLFKIKGFNLYRFYFYSRGLSHFSLIFSMILFLLFDGFSYCSDSYKGFFSSLYFAKFRFSRLVPSFYWLLGSGSFFNSSIFLNYCFYLFNI